MKIGFIGFGRMGSVIAARGLKAGRFRRKDLIVYAPSVRTQKKIRALKIRLAKDAAEVAQVSRTIWLCVKPQKMNEALSTLRGSRFSEKCFVSIAAGVTMEKLEKALGRVAVIRVMPNTPAVFGAGISAVSRGRYANAAHERQVRTILSSLGEVVSVKEKDMHAVTAVSGSGPAYVFNLAEALIAGAKKVGLNEKLATQLVRQTIFGAGQMLKASKVSAAELRHQVTSPGGTTAAALAEFERRGFQKMVAAALQKAVKRSKELSKSL